MNHKVYLKRRDAGLCVQCGIDLRITGESGVRCYTCNEKRHSYKHNSTWLLKLRVMRAYGRKCACCREWRIEFLEIDHIDGNGKEHRDEIRSTAGDSFYKWLVRNEYPKGNIQVLCANCHVAKSRVGECPHVRERAALAAK